MLAYKKQRGDVITFVDADDFLELDMLEKMLEEYEEKKLVVCSYNQIFEEKIKSFKESEKKNIFSVEDTLSFLANRKKIQGYPWNKMFSKNIIKEKKIEFPENISICEDLIFVVNYIKHVDEVVYINENLYNYRIRKNSAVNNFKNIDKRLTVIYAYEILIDLYNKKNVCNDYLKYWILKETMKIKRLCYKNNEERYKQYCNDIVKKYFNKDIFLKCKIEIKDKINLLLVYIITEFFCLYNK